MLLDTALQTPVKSTSDIVKVELPLPDVSRHTHTHSDSLTHGWFTGQDSLQFIQIKYFYKQNDAYFTVGDIDVLNHDWISLSLLG